MNAIALSGATSMIGVALVKQCILNSVKVYALVRPGSPWINRLPASDLITVLERDLDSLADSELPDAVTSKVDVFYHVGWRDTDKIGRNSCDKQLLNIQYTLDAVRLAKKLGCKKFIGTGSQAEYGHASIPLNGTVPTNPEIAYGIAKYAAGKLAQIECEKLGLEYNWVRILSVYGINDSSDTLIKKFITNCKNDQPMGLSPCTHIWDYLFEDDAGRALFAIGKKGIDGKVYCLGSGTGKPLMEYLETVKKMINPDYVPRYGDVPYSEKSVRYLCADITELTNDTGWMPAVWFEEGIKKILDDKYKGTYV
ncbi:CDP-abequose synthase [Spirochaetia bacterium]|nr:CDP-abequose synthase [Spirochaetia bacterium]